MTPKQERFVEEYLVDLNATQAATRAGYSARNADKIGSQLLGKTRVAAAIEAAKAQLSKRVEVTLDYVVGNLVEIVERTMQRAPVLEFDRDKKVYVQATDADGNAIWQFDARNAVGALGLLGKRTGGFSDKHELSGDVTLTVEVVYSRE